MTTRYDYLIVGGGMTADAAARGIRELDSSGTIGILSADVDPPYTRPALSKKLWTDPDFGWDQVPLGTVEATGAELRLETVVTAIDRDDRLVSTSDGDEVGYERLLLATGGTPHRAGLPHDDRIIAYRSAADYRSLRDLASPGAHAAVVGGGFIATEIAAALIQNGVRVTLVYPEAVLEGSVRPADLAERFEARFREAGVALLPGRRVTGGATSTAEVVLDLDDGSRVSADVVVLGLGVSPVVDFAAEAGLEVEDGVVVDERLRTADERIWAAGDIALYPDRILGRTRVEHVDNAEQMGRQAGRSMAGDDASYSHTPEFYSDVFDVSYEAVGSLDASLETLEDWQEPLEKGVVYYLDGDAPVGVLLWNVFDAVDEARAVLADPPTTREGLVGRIGGPPRVRSR